MNKHKVSFVLGTYNRKIFLKLTIQSIRSEALNIPHEIIVVDGGSTDGTLHWLMKQKDVITILQHNRGSWRGEKIVRRSWGYFMNLGFKCAQGKYICMLSDDCILVPGAVNNGLKLVEERTNKEENVGACAFYFRSWPDEKRYYVSKVLEKTFNVNHGLFLREALEKIQYIDENRYAFYYGDIDLALRLVDAGYVVIDSPTSFVEHTLHADNDTRKSNITRSDEDFFHFKEKWGNQISLLDKNAAIKNQEIESNKLHSTVNALKVSSQLKKLNFKYVFVLLRHKIGIRERTLKIKNYVSK